MTSTERKLDEARYFLKKLDVRDPYFDYILSAFLNAARSTTWIMKCEFGKTEGWEKWFQFNIISDKQNKIKEINKLRIESAKKKGIKTDFFILDSIEVDETSYSEVSKLLKREGERFEITIEEVGKEKGDKKNIRIPAKDEHIRINGKVNINKASKYHLREDIFELSKEYFYFLERKVVDCIKLFT